MFWTRTESPYEPPAWDRESVMAALPVFDPHAVQTLTREQRAYCGFYGLDLDVERPDVTYRLGTLAAGGFQIALHYYRRPRSRATVFLMHGYLDHSGLYTRLIAHCLDEGLDVVIYDLPGHGLSNGEFTAIRSFRDYQRVLTDVLEYFEDVAISPWFAVGQSTGGAVLIDFLLSNRQTRDASVFRGVTLLAPLIRPAGFASIRRLHTVVGPFVRQWRRAFVDNSNDSTFVEFLREHDPLQAQVMAVDWVTALRRWVRRIEAAPPLDYELTVVQGEGDTTVDWRHNLRVIRRKFSRVRVYQVPEARHHLVNEAEPILRQVFDAVSESVNRALGSPGEK